MKQLKQFYITVLFIFAFGTSFSQTPFVCDGSFYLSLTSGGSSQVYQVTIDNVTGNVLFNALTNNAGANVNAMGYRITDNFIYGVNPSSSQLYRVDATGSATLVTTLGIGSGGNSLVAGDITPDGDTLILIEAVNQSDISLHKVEMSSGNYTSTSISFSLQSTGNTPNFRTADIAIDPINGDVYGYNGVRLLKYNTSTGLIDDTSFPVQTPDVLGALFFDAFGGLHAYGRPSGGNSQNTFYDIDKSTGIITAVSTGPSAQGNDGCSCPYTIKMQKTANVDTIPQCGKVIWEFEIVNRSGIDRTGIDFQDVLPPDFTVTQVTSSFFVGTTSITANTVNLTNITLPVGVSTLQIEAKVSATASGTYFNQGILFNLPAGLGGTAPSDNPLTSLVDDPTPITVIPTLSATALGDTTVCDGGSSALLNAFGTNGTGAPYSYSWSSATGQILNPNAQSPTVIPNGTTTYTVTVTDSEGCTATDDVVVTVDTLDFFLGEDTVICIFDSILLDATYPNLDGISFLWSDGSTDTTFWAVGTGTFWGMITDACGNSISDTISVTESYINVLTTLSADSTSCFGGNDGSADVTVTQGTPPYAYQWSDGQNTTIASGLSSGTYSITTTDANNCRNINSVFVPEPSEILTTMTLVDSAKCFGDATGSAFASAIGGTGNLTYTWSTIPAQTTQLATGLFGPSNYVVTVTDFYQCEQIDTIFIPSPSQITLQTFSAGTICYQASDATATVTANGGTPYYTYQWDANAMSQTTASATNLASGVYTVTVTDFYGCTSSAALSVGEALPIIFNYEDIQPSCFGDSDGSITLSLENGNPPFTYLWDNSITNNRIENLSSGIYFITVTDSLGCVQSDSFKLEEPLELKAELSKTDLSCFESTDGQIYILAIGGNPYYEYSINGSDFSSAHIINGLDAGNYYIEVQDTNECTVAESITLTQPDEVIVDVGEDLTIEQGDSIILSATSSRDSTDLAYQWKEQFQRNSILYPTCPSTYVKPLEDMYYTLSVVDTNGCSAEDGLWVRVIENRVVAIPNAFTPNDDNVNDVFMIHAEQPIQGLSLKIYDRWGELIFEQYDFPVNDPSFGWNGTFRGEVLDPAVFGWVLEVEFLDGEVKALTGNVTLLK